MDEDEHGLRMSQIGRPRVIPVPVFHTRMVLSHIKQLNFYYIAEH
jgi:hypothetical protein